jgi:tetratricopeptide (TPR) repeat protein
MKRRLPTLIAALSLTCLLQIPAWANPANPSTGRDYLNRAWGAFHQGYVDRSFGDFYRAIEMEPLMAEGYIGLALLYLQKNMPEQALTELNRGIDVIPKSAPLLNLRGLTHLRVGGGEHRPLALNDFNQAIAVEPNFTEAWYHRGAVYAAMGQAQKALDDLNKAIELNPEYGLAYVQRAKVQPSQQLALKDLDQAMNLKMRTAEVFMLYGKTHLSTGDATTALRYLNQSLEVAPSQLAYLLRGRAHALLQQNTEAEADLKRMAALTLSSPEAYFERGRLQLELKRYEAAATDLSEAIKRQPEDAQIYFLRAQAQGMLQKSAEALADYQKACGLGMAEACGKSASAPAK